MYFRVGVRFLVCMCACVRAYLMWKFMMICSWVFLFCMYVLTFTYRSVVFFLYICIIVFVRAFLFVSCVYVCVWARLCVCMCIHANMLCICVSMNVWISVWGVTWTKEGEKRRKHLTFFALFPSLTQFKHRRIVISTPLRHRLLATYFVQNKKSPSECRNE